MQGTAGAIHTLTHKMSMSCGRGKVCEPCGITWSSAFIFQKLSADLHLTHIPIAHKQESFLTSDWKWGRRLLSFHSEVSFPNTDLVYPKDRTPKQEASDVADTVIPSWRLWKVKPLQEQRKRCPVALDHTGFYALNNSPNTWHSTAEPSHHVKIHDAALSFLPWWFHNHSLLESCNSVAWIKGVWNSPHVNFNWQHLLDGRRNVIGNPEKGVQWPLRISCVFGELTHSQWEVFRRPSVHS